MNRGTSAPSFIVLLTVLGLMLFGCSGGGQVDGANPVVDNDYFVSSDLLVDTEHSTYVFEVGESREIYVMGRLPENDLDFDKYGRVWWVYSADRRESGIWTNLDQSTRRYTTSITLDPNIVTTGPYDFTAHIGNGYTSQGQKAFTVRVVEDRQFEYYYACQTNNDVFGASIGFDTDTYLTSAFAKALTSLNRTTRTTSLTEQTVYFGDGNGFYYYVASLTPGGLSGTSTLVAVKNGDYPSEPNAAGVTETSMSYGGFDYGYSFIFLDKMRATNSGDNLRKDITRATLHEMGHLRGRGVDITDLLTHTLWHNGELKGKCSMLTVTTENVGGILEKLTFCEGHCQVLMNRE